MNNTLTTISKEKARKLKHVKVYDRLYSMIKDGTFPPGTQLPSEPELALQMNVSRMTLRRSLALLQEDNLVQNIQGKGNFVKSQSSPATFYETEHIQHPFVKCSTIDSDSTELEFRIEPPSDYMKQSVHCDTAAVVISDRWYKKKNAAIGYTLSIIPIETISNYKIDLSNLESFLVFLEKTIYDLSLDSRCSYSYTNTGNFTSTKYTLSNNSNFFLIQETLYDNNHIVLLFNKHYIPLHNFSLEVCYTNQLQSSPEN
ncbi:GntR family transcriptional regulator [Anaerosacchariphilus polymeriproducens]|uniref:GntR family transcriptional regulator n=1 Tax=Anaerosacchariphilus polymeriproducens TaxID=1812858 RepID=A0A371AVX4_9FIRM|nr:GntR family transcriptional regulator [Anaerosacchariphilus polymeriproducens]RDU23723.1 GntR family transcriptional regulator [Anaerosacchariphilus polymeriproducens]